MVRKKFETNPFKRNYPTRIKFVKKANKWTRTSWENGDQKQEWFDTKPDDQIITASQES